MRGLIITTSNAGPDRRAAEDRERLPPVPLRALGALLREGATVVIKRLGGGSVGR